MITFFRCQIKDIWLIFEWNFILWHGILLWKSALWYCIWDTIWWSVIRKMHFMIFLPFCGINHPAIRMSNLLTFADFSLFDFFANIHPLFSYPNMLSRKNFIPQQKFIILFQPPSNYLLPQPPVKLNDHSLNKSVNGTGTIPAQSTSCMASIQLSHGEGGKSLTHPQLETAKNLMASSQHPFCNR